MRNNDALSSPEVPESGRNGTVCQLASLPAEVISAYDLGGACQESRPYGSGHINDTFVAAFDVGGVRVRYIFQRINHHIFRDPVALMENILRVTEEQQRQLAASGVSDAVRRSITVVRAKDGKVFFRDADGSYWRCYRFIEGARTYDVIEQPRQAFEAAKAFGSFQKLVANLSGNRLFETIPEFHNTRTRFERLREIAATAAARKLSQAAREWSWIREREEMVDVLLDLHGKGEIPERITHNDTKLNNVMVDEATQVGICVIDLDTVMPGLALYDFGDLVRTATSPVAEDEPDVSKVCVQIPMFEALVKGYLSSAGDFLTHAEKEHLVFSGKLIALETGIRFLTDYLEGDVYFKTAYPGHNLDRCRTQMALVRSIEAQETVLKRIVDRSVKSSIAPRL